MGVRGSVFLSHGSSAWKTDGYPPLFSKKAFYNMKQSFLLFVPRDLLFWRNRNQPKIQEIKGRWNNFIIRFFLGQIQIVAVRWMNECITKLLHFGTRGGEIQWFMSSRILDTYWKTLGISTFSHDALRGADDDFLLSENERPASLREVKYILRFCKTWS